MAEGPTNAVVIEAALRSMLGGRSFVLKQVFPEDSAAFGAMGTGWVGIYRWCHAAANRGTGRLSGDPLIFGAGNFDLLLLHLDGDVAGCESLFKSPHSISMRWCGLKPAFNRNGSGRVSFRAGRRVVARKNRYMSHRIMRLRSRCQPENERPFADRPPGHGRTFYAR